LVGVVVGADLRGGRAAAAGIELDIDDVPLYYSSRGAFSSLQAFLEVTRSGAIKVYFWTSNSNANT
jgi:hypothetical protein